MGQHTAHMRRHVVRPFRSVGKHRISVGHSLRHENFEVAQDSRVGILTQHQRRAGMADEDIAQAHIDSGVANRRLYLARNVVSAAASRTQVNLRLTDHNSGPGTYG